MAHISLLKNTAAAVSMRMARLATWAHARRTARALQAASPDMREDLGLSLADMRRISM